MSPASELSDVAIGIMRQRGFVLVEREARNWKDGRQEMDETPHIGLFKPGRREMPDGYVQSMPRRGVRQGSQTHMETPNLDRLPLANRVVALEKLFASAVPFQHHWTQRESPIPIYVEDAYLPWKIAAHALAKKYPGQGRSSELRVDLS